MTSLPDFHYFFVNSGHSRSRVVIFRAMACRSVGSASLPGTAIFSPVSHDCTLGSVSRILCSESAYGASERHSR